MIAPPFTFDRALLPAPIAFLARHKLLIGEPKAEYAFINCPAHSPRSRTMRVSLVSGAFRCTTCHVHGRDVIDLHRLSTGCGFHQAVRELCGPGGHG